MATQPVSDRPVSVDEYLSMVFEHDLGEFERSYVQGILVGLFLKNREAWGVYPLPEQRVQTQKTHFRVPDVTILREGTPRERILTRPPLLVIEVQSPETPLSRMAKKSVEYLAFGIEHIWVIDPYARVAFRGTPQGLNLVRTGELSISGTPIRIVLDDLFGELDRV